MNATANAITNVATASATALFRYPVNGFMIMARQITNQTRNVLRVTVTAPWSTKENPIKFQRDIDLDSVTFEQAHEKALALSARFAIGASKFDIAYKKDGKLVFNDEKLHFTIKADSPAPAQAVQNVATEIPSVSDVAEVVVPSRKAALAAVGDRMRKAI